MRDWQAIVDEIEAPKGMTVQDFLNIDFPSRDVMSLGPTDEESPAVIPKIETVQSMITEAKGIFIGKDELVSLGKIPRGADVPSIPVKFSAAFLNSPHPLRDGTIASHLLLALDVDPDSGKMSWHAIDRGRGGESDAVPGSLGIQKPFMHNPGLTASEQDELIEGIEVEGLKLESPQDSYPIERILNNARALHGSLYDYDPPFHHLHLRTGDTQRANPGCRISLCYDHKLGVQVNRKVPSNESANRRGLIAAWY